MSSRKSKKVYSRKLKEATHLLFLKHHRLPGVRGWELRKELGPDWLDVLDVLDNVLKQLDLQITRVLDEPELSIELTAQQLADARFCITIRGTIDQKIAKTIGWRIDDIAGLAVSIAFIISKQGKSPRGEVEKILSDKLPGWRIGINLDKYIEEGYLGEDEGGYLYLNWRSRAEIDQKHFVDLILSFGEKK